MCSCRGAWSCTWWYRKWWLVRTIRTSDYEATQWAIAWCWPKRQRYDQFDEFVWVWHIRQGWQCESLVQHVWSKRLEEQWVLLRSRGEWLGIPSEYNLTIFIRNTTPNRMDPHMPGLKAWVGSMNSWLVWPIHRCKITRPPIAPSTLTQ